MSDPGRRGGEGPTGSRPFQPLPADARRDLDPLASVSSEDRQYQEDLKKALMLSLETLAAENEQRRRSAAARSPEKKSLQHQPGKNKSNALKVLHSIYYHLVLLMLPDWAH